MRPLVRYAGYEEPQAERAERREAMGTAARPLIANHYRAWRAYDQFRLGKDTLEIAQFMRVQEHTVLRWINEARAAKRGLRSPYKAAPQ